MRLLIVEDEPTLADQIRRVLQSEGRVVDLVHDGVEAAYLGSVEPYDAIVLDIGLPGRDGLSVLKEWRAQGIAIPVLILTARDGWSERVDGLDAGADDYLTKPFHMRELSARIRAMLRRTAGQANPVFEKAGVVFDSRTSRTMVEGMPIDLTAQETAVLSYLFHHTGRLVSRSELSEHIYSHDSDPDSNTIAVFVTRLRKKLGARLIQTVRGAGYTIGRD
jgi:two-component system OmpR family response regulator